jgi:hypothetical protein
MAKQENDTFRPPVILNRTLKIETEGGERGSNQVLSSDPGGGRLGM